MGGDGGVCDGGCFFALPSIAAQLPRRCAEATLGMSHKDHRVGVSAESHSGSHVSIAAPRKFLAKQMTSSLKTPGGSAAAPCPSSPTSTSSVSQFHIFAGAFI